MTEVPYMTNYLLRYRGKSRSSSALAHRFQNRLLFDVFGSDAPDFPNDLLDTIEDEIVCALFIK
jgi:hypothetical protein